MCVSIKIYILKVYQGTNFLLIIYDIILHCKIIIHICICYIFFNFIVFFWHTPFCWQMTRFENCFFLKDFFSKGSAIYIITAD